MAELKRKAGEQSILLVQKQTEADTALKDITTAMQVGVYAGCSCSRWLRLFSLKNTVVLRVVVVRAPAGGGGDVLKNDLFDFTHATATLHRRYLQLSSFKKKHFFDLFDFICP